MQTIIYDILFRIELFNYGYADIDGRNVSSEFLGISSEISNITIISPDEKSFRETFFSRYIENILNDYNSRKNELIDYNNNLAKTIVELVDKYKNAAISPNDNFELEKRPDLEMDTNCDFEKSITIVEILENIDKFSKCLYYYSIKLRSNIIKKMKKMN